MKCPDCSAELADPCKIPTDSAPHPVMPWEHLDCDKIGCPVCGFFAHEAYWAALADETKSPYQNIPFRPKTHWLKILPKYFYGIFTGVKTFEIRKNDTGFKIGHLIIFQMWTPERGYCNRSLCAEIRYVTDFPDGLKPGYVVLGIRKL